MSTILDALRKVEENHRTRSADARARLLSFPARPGTRSSRQRRTPWIIGAGLTLVGFAVGAGLMLWEPRSPAPKESQLASATDGGVTPDKEEDSLESSAQPTPGPAVAAPSQPPVQPLSRATAEKHANSATTEPIPSRRSLEERRAARAERGDIRARRTARRDALVAELRDFDPASGAAQPQPQPLLQSHKSAQPVVAPAPRPAAPSTQSPVPAPVVATAPSGTVTASPDTVTAPPNTALSFLQWSPEPDKRLAFIKIEGGPLTLAHEGDTVAGYTVVEIRRDAVELSANGHSFMLQAQQ